jgi:hypothetical protein
MYRKDGNQHHVRQERHAGQELIPANTGIQFTLDKDKMKLRANGKKYVYLIVSEIATARPKP